MITVRNDAQAASLSVRAADATLSPGMLVVMVQSASVGDQPLVRKATSAEMADATIQKFIVDYIQPDSLDVDFNINVQSQGLTSIPKTIPQGAQCNVWFGLVQIAYHSSLLPVALTTTREGTKMGFDAGTNLPSDAATAELVCGFVYRIDTPEHTFVVKL